MYNIVAGRNALYTHDTEFTFKRHVMSPVMRAAVRRLFSFKEVCQWIYLFILMNQGYLTEYITIILFSVDCF